MKSSSAFVVLSLFAFGCSAAPISGTQGEHGDDGALDTAGDVPESTGQVAQASLTETRTLVRRTDGFFDVTCETGAREVKSAAEVQGDRLCERNLPVQCVPQCTQRFPNGQCGAYGPDFCARGATRCVPHCTQRFPNGQCGAFGPDVCSVGDVTCLPSCTARWPNGDCQTYGADACAVAPFACTPTCAARWPNGQCQRFGQDLCYGAPVECVPQCTARFLNGQCSAYGPDFCGPASGSASQLGGVQRLAQRAWDRSFDAACYDGFTVNVSQFEVRSGDVCRQAVGVACQARCTARYVNGQCSAYGPDLCGVGAFTCVPHCTSRYPNGQCAGFGGDFCGRAPVQCVPYCAARWPDGTCRQWGPDRCDQSVP